MDSRPRWTEERLDDLAGEVHEGFRQVREDIRELRHDTHEEIRDLRREMREGHRWLMGLQLTTLLGLVAVAVQVATH